MSFDTTIDRRKFLRDLAVGGAVISAAGIGILLYERPSPPNIDIRIGEKATPIPAPWFDADILPQLKVDTQTIDRSKIESLDMKKIPYKGICECNPQRLIYTSFWVRPLPDVLEKMGIDQKGMVGARAVSTDRWSRTTYNPKTLFFSASGSNVEPEYHTNAYPYISEQGIRAKLTPYGTITKSKPVGRMPENNTDLMLIERLTDYSLEEGSYFLDQDGNKVRGTPRDLERPLDSYVLDLFFNGEKHEIPYHDDIKRVAETHLVEFRGQRVPFIFLNELLGLRGISPGDYFIMAKAPGYGVAIPSNRQDNVGLAFDERLTPTRGSPAKIYSPPENENTLLGDAARAEGVIEMYAEPMRA